MLDLMRRYVLPGQTVLDPFLGGGASAIAIGLGANFIGYDIDPDCVAATRTRLARPATHQRLSDTLRS
jgi:site-specific DNA-methyltransferase (adenine-specific)